MSECSSKGTRPFVESDADLEPNSYSLQKFMVYETQTRFYLVGRDKTGLRWRVLKIDRSEPTGLNVYEDPAIYTKQDCNDLLKRLVEGNRSCGGVNFVTKAYGIVGFIKFLEPYYMILITKRRLLGNICGHAIYGVGESLLLTVPHPSVLSSIARLKAESRYKRLFTSIDLTKDFFFSYTYRIMWCLQNNVKASQRDRMPYDDMFVWNAYLTQEIRSELRSSHWTVALVHGFFQQVKLSIGSAQFILTLIARRSRHFAGTRYLKRGVNAKGRVANDVETEQLVHEEKNESCSQISSVVQHRGSIPLFWSQETSILSPKPDIVLHKKDPTYEATRLHFQNLASRYGNPVIVLNLVKTVEKRPRETILCREFASAVAYLNHALPKAERVKFIQWDFHMFSRRKSANVLEVLESIALDALDMTGFYYSGNAEVHFDTTHEEPICDSSIGEESCHQRQEVEPEVCAEQSAQGFLQQGVLRSNCIDCLDRTNVAQYAFGLAALGRQMYALGLSSVPRIGSNSGLAVTLMDLYERMGDVLAVQYGGSAAHNKVFSQRQGKWNATIQSLEFFRSIRRHYNNAYLDGEKQDAINIFLGHFRPEVGKLELWQLDSDIHLQVRRAGDDTLSDCRMVKRSISAGDMFEQNGNSGILRDSFSMKPSVLCKPTPLLIALGRRGITVSEAEMRKGFEEGEYGAVNDSGQEGGSSCSMHGVCVSLSKAVDSRGLGDCADIDWLSSSGNSCEEDAQERHSVSVTDGDSWQSSGFLPSTHEEAETYEDSEYFQDLTNTLLANGNVWRHEREAWQQSFEEVEACHTLQEIDVGSGIIRIRTGAASRGVFSQSFVDWIHEGETLCY
ncbi:hypothetical protein GOP47_0000099 [Adiantum capillus-veneris]|uniref:SAC domain-containing protein n=1 Tax=Adiantum capillus-veneris TaxID=13818 RepID=A0A9D4VDA4_ADICA|nr:hypothetical protein GOP47_0000099 [Adiantum capillus-veneris]